jgi:hypothetical protein
MPRNFIAVNKEVNPMKEMQNHCSNTVASHRKSNTLRMLALPALLLTVAIVFVLSSPVPSTSATAKNARLIPLVLAQDECVDIPQEGNTVCTDETNGSQTCTRNFREPFSMPVTNPCTGETVQIEGEMHEVTHITTNNNSTHTRFHMEMHGTGTTVPSPTASANGFKYLFASTRANQGTDYTFSTNTNGGLNSGPPPENFSDPMDVRIISHGRSPNFLMHFVLHTNVTPGGQTSCIVHTSTECSGNQGEIGQ